MNIQERMESNKKLFDRILPDMLPAAPHGQEEVVEAMRYSLANGGKRIRPLLVMAFAQACGNTGAKYDDALPYACAVEMIHTYSLIHDDLPCMDDDDMRRGQPACHKKFGEATALLAGDALLTRAFELMANAALTSDLPADVLLRMMQLLSNKAGVAGMIGGQVLDLQYENQSVTIDQIQTVYALKTSALIEAACLLGCYAAGADEKLLAGAREYAQKLGLAFQIQDDILDITSDEATLGKPIGSDAENHKATYVSLLGLEQAKQLVKELTEDASAAVQIFPCSSDVLRDIAYALVERKN